MRDDDPTAALRRPRGAAGTLFIVFAGVALGGAALDFVLGGSDRFWIAADPGMRAALGLGAAIFALGVQVLMRRFLFRAELENTERRDGDHA